MKPDKVICQNCGEQIEKGKWCSDKCRKAHGRKSDNPDTRVGQNPDKTNPDTDILQVGQAKSDKDEFRASLTKTDKTFYDRAMRDYKEPYYKFGSPVKEVICLHCWNKFKTSLSMLRFCSYDHYSDALSGKKYEKVN